MNDYRFNQTEALMFLFHFFGDLHVPLHVEGFAQGGNLIKVCFDGHHDNLHSVWDTDMPHKINGIKHHSRHNEEKEASRKWAKRLIQQNQYTPSTAVDVTDPRKWIMQWAEETNRLNCAVVFERGLEYLEKEDLAREYYDDAAPIIEEQIFKAGVRLAIWTNSLAEKRRANMTFVIQGDRSREL